MLDVLERLPDVSFIDNLTLEEIQETLVRLFTQRYEQTTGKVLVLRKADPRTRFLHAMGVALYQSLQYVDRAGKQDLLKYAYGEFLDNQAAFWGLIRNPAAPAHATIQFRLSALQSSAASIPRGTRVTNGAGLYFATDDYAEIPAGEWEINVPATCTVPGAEANSLSPGSLKALVDPLPYIASAVNIDETNGGSDVEDDDQLRVRVFLAPASDSTAGPIDAYIQHTLSYSAAIGSVNVSSPRPGDVEVRVLLKDGSLPSETLCAEILEYLSDKTIRPLTDHVFVMPPDSAVYNVDLTYWIATSSAEQAVSIQRAVAAAVNAFNDWQTGAIGRDINPSELIRRIMEAGAKRVEVREPLFTIVPPGSIAQLGGCAVTYGDLEDD